MGDEQVCATGRNEAALVALSAETGCCYTVGDVTVSTRTRSAPRQPLECRRLGRDRRSVQRKSAGGSGRRGAEEGMKNGE